MYPFAYDVLSCSNSISFEPAFDDFAKHEEVRVVRPCDIFSSDSSDSSLTPRTGSPSSDESDETLIDCPFPSVPPTLSKKRSWKSFKNSLLPELREGNVKCENDQNPHLLNQKNSLQRPSTINARAHRRRPSSTEENNYGNYESYSDDNGSDDEYIPPPDLCTRKRQRSLSIAPGVSSLSSTIIRRPVKRMRVAPPSRNKQASDATSAIISKVVKTSATEKINFTCPECKWKQLNRRLPDFKRHLKTHLRADNDDHYSGFWCKGVKCEDSDTYHIPAESQPYTFRGDQYIGGCMRTFSRRDALKRHLDNQNLPCVSED